MKSLNHILPKKTFGMLEPSSFPGFVAPMLATLTEDYFDHPDWIYERKLDGERCIAAIQDGKAQLFSRNRTHLNPVYPELATALEGHPFPDLIVDGEIVAFEDSLTSFSKLQHRMHLQDKEKIRKSAIKVFLYLFDILYYDHYDLTSLTLNTRKQVLKQVMVWESPIRYTLHRREHGTDFLKDACSRQWEGLIAKNGQASYVHSRSKNWLKFKCSMGQELVIGGYTEPQGTRLGFGALLVGYYQKEELLYAGKVGSGFDDEFLQTWHQKFKAVERDHSPFHNYDQEKKGNNHWIQPIYVGQFEFTEWTKTNKLRHPRFLGMRNDKNPKKVVKE